MPRYRHDPSKSLVGFVVGEVEYAVAIACVKEIANPLTVVPLPHAPKSVIGVADYRDDVVSVVDLRMRFGLAAAATTRKTKWIVIDVGERVSERDPSPIAATATTPPAPSAEGRLVALVVDAVTGVFGTTGTELRPAPDLGAGEDARGIAGVTTNDDTLVFVLDATRFRDLAREATHAPARASLPPRGGTGRLAARTQT
jgi:purine-binding chemotaxis protein CheW